MAMKAAAFLASLCLYWAAAAQTMEHVSISQVVDRPSTLEAYLDVRNTNDTAVEGLTSASVQATLEGKPVPVVSLKPFASIGEGVGYVFLVDVSQSESRAEFAHVQEALQGFVDHLYPVDRAAIVTFGEKTSLAVSYTGNKEELKHAILQLADKAPMTHLNEGLIEGLRLARRLDPGLPARRSIVILSDGKDEGSGFNEDDVLRVLQENRIPIYAVGASNLPKPDRAKYLEVLHRYALLSGGAYYDANSDKVNSAYTQIYDRISRVWVAHFDCSACLRDGRSNPLQIQVTVHGQSLADKVNVTLIAHPPLPTPPVAKPWWMSFTRTEYIGAGVGLFLLIIGFIFLMTRRKKPTPVPPPELLAESRPPAMQQGMPPIMPPPSPTEAVRLPILDTRPGVLVELTRRDLRNGASETFSGKLVDTLIVGRSSEAGLRISDGSISSRHCELEFLDGRVLVSDAGSTYGTFLNGVPVKARQRLESGDTLALGTIEFRVSLS